MKTCNICQTSKTKKWYAGPICKSCYNKAYLKANRARMYALQKAWMTPERRAKFEKNYRTAHYEQWKTDQRYRESLHRAKLLQATPSWLTKEHKQEIKAIYHSCPNGYHVDHILPLKGENVSGLHVPWNLQHLPAEVNIAKSNKLT